jgi:hypothetical protein
MHPRARGISDKANAKRAAATCAVMVFAKARHFPGFYQLKAMGLAWKDARADGHLAARGWETIDAPRSGAMDAAS